MLLRSFAPKAITLLLTVLLLGCEQLIALHTGLSEQSANEVVAELSRHYVDAQKVQTKEGFDVMIDTQDMAKSVQVLDAAGLPKALRSSLGDIFKKEGVISTPLEERARYIYALSQELEETLSEIDGVIVARVHVVLPERVAPGEPIQPASASVFIKHRGQLDPDVVLPRIRRMVQNSIPGLTAADKKLAIEFVRSHLQVESPDFVPFGPFMLPADQAELWQGLMLWIGGAVIVLIILLVAWLKRSPKGQWTKPEPVANAQALNGHG